MRARAATRILEIERARFSIRMKSWQREVDLSFRGWAVALTIASVAAIAWAILLGTRARKDPSRCPSDQRLVGARCCALGQGYEGGHCLGAPSRCPDGFERVQRPEAGCVALPRKIELVGGSVTLGPTDWDSVDVVQKHVVAVRSFRIDRTEVTQHQYAGCLEVGACTERPASFEREPVEPGLPVTSISADAAADYCHFAGGRLPTPAEWTYAATGTEARRFPWGAHGLVCRRAAFGLARGPCAEGGISPDIAGSRPDGATPDGVLDLAGNVAEWTRTADGILGLSGGSFRSELAADLKTWSSRAATVADDVGFRCAYASGR